jgi:hypothetical protein
MIFVRQNKAGSRDRARLTTADLAKTRFRKRRRREIPLVPHATWNAICWTRCMSSIYRTLDDGPSTEISVQRVQVRRNGKEMAPRLAQHARRS